jgi:cobalt-zinc-cadmium efflux system membrane fusion protein
MASGRRSVTTIVAVALLIGAVGVHSAGHIYGWLKSGLEAASTDAKAQGSDAAAGRTAAPVGAPSVELNDKQMATVKVETVGEYVFPVEKSVDAGVSRG